MELVTVSHFVKKSTVNSFDRELCVKVILAPSVLSTELVTVFSFCQKSTVNSLVSPSSLRSTVDFVKKSTGQQVSLQTWNGKCQNRTEKGVVI